jgi:predicted nucleic acid-binding protein
MISSLVVIDASVAVKAVLPNPLQLHCFELVQTFIDRQPAAPALWSYETTSAIAKSVYFKEITEKEARQALEKLDMLDVRLFVPDTEQNLAAFNWTLRLKRASAYDGYYLALAQVLECDFWTADKRLFNALQDTHLDWVHWIEELTP